MNTFLDPIRGILRLFRLLGGFAYRNTMDGNNPFQFSPGLEIARVVGYSLLFNTSTLADWIIFMVYYHTDPEAVHIHHSKDKAGYSAMDTAVSCTFGVVGQTLAFALFAVYKRNWVPLNRLLREMRDLQVAIEQRTNNGDPRKTITARLRWQASVLLVGGACLTLYIHLMSGLVYANSTPRYILVALTPLAMGAIFPPFVVGNTVMLSLHHPRGSIAIPGLC